MRITVDVPPELEARLREGAIHQDRETVQRLLTEAVAPTVEAMLRESSGQLSEDHFEALADQLADELDRCSAADRPFLSDAAVSREGIYEGRDA